MTDSTNAKEIAVHAVYSIEQDPRSIYLLTGVLDERTYKLTTDAQLTDSSGNALTKTPIYFAGRSRADTAQVRFMGFLPDGRSDLGPRDVPGLIFSQAVSDSLFATLVSACRYRRQHVSAYVYDRQRNAL